MWTQVAFRAKQIAETERIYFLPTIQLTHVIVISVYPPPVLQESMPARPRVLFAHSSLCGLHRGSYVSKVLFIKNNEIVGLQMHNPTFLCRTYLKCQVISAIVVIEFKYPCRVRNKPAFPQVVVNTREVPRFMSSIPVE